MDILKKVRDVFGKGITVGQTVRLREGFMGFRKERIGEVEKRVENKILVRWGGGIKKHRFFLMMNIRDI